MLNSGYTLWILEDDADSRFIYEETLGIRYQVEFFVNLGDLSRKLESSTEFPSMIVADLRLPDGNFIDFYEKRRKTESPLPPFVVVSSLDDLDFLRASYREGALDFLTKPFSKNELIAKIERLLPKLGTSSRTPQGIVLNPQTLKIEDISNRALQLTAKEYQILSILHRANDYVTREKLQQEIWGRVNVHAKTLDVHVFNIRKKAAGIGIVISYHSEHGYRLSGEIKQSDE